jgi:MarR family transcriptional regulator, organic hydroperoxide resistance regulator
MAHGSAPRIVSDRQIAENDELGLFRQGDDTAIGAVSRATGGRSTSEADAASAAGRPVGRHPQIDWPTLTSTLRPENSPGFLLWQVTNLWQRRLRAALDPHGLTHVQFVLLAGLAWLEAREPNVSQARLAQFCKTDAMMTSQVVRALEREELIRRASSVTDRRARSLQVSDRGADVLNKAMPAVLEADAEFFGCLPANQVHLVQTLRFLWQNSTQKHLNGE